MTYLAKNSRWPFRSSAVDGELLLMNSLLVWRCIVEASVNLPFHYNWHEPCVSVFAGIMTYSLCFCHLATKVTETASEILGRHRQKKKALGHCRNSWYVRHKKRTQRETIWTWRIWEIQGSEQQHQEVHEKGNWKGEQCSEIEENLRKNNSKSRESIPAHRRLDPLWNKEKLLLSKIIQENASQKNERYWTDGQNSALGWQSQS